MVGLGAIASFSEKALDLVSSYFPPSMSDKEKHELSLKLKDAAYKAELQQQEYQLKERQQFYDRIRELEGSGSDLTRVPFMGSLMLFLRGSQRPVWGFATIYLDYMYFFGGVTVTQSQEDLIQVVNLLVLGFLFGERAIKNVTPILGRAFAKKG